MPGPNPNPQQPQTSKPEGPGMAKKEPHGASAARSRAAHHTHVPSSVCLLPSQDVEHEGRLQGG